MKKIYLLGLIAFLGMQAGFAQSYDINRTEKNKGFAQQLSQPYVDWSVQTMERVNTFLNLTEDQKDEIVYINFMYAKRMQILAEKGSAPEEIKAHKKDMINFAFTDYERVLTDVQKSKLSENKEAIMQASL